MKSSFIKNLKISIVLLITILTFNNKLKAQLSGGDAFMKGTSVEIGVDGTNGFEGAGSAAPGGYHFRGGFGLSGFVADPLLSAWANYNGDFFTPGTPENGWGLLIGNSAAGLQLGNNAAGPSLISTGAGVSYANFGTSINVCWNGSVVSGTNNISANIVYSLGTNNLYYTTTVKLTNNSTSAIPEMYYYRNVDPDNNQSLSGSFVTDQLIENQSTTDPCALACVSASQAATGTSGVSYMAFAGVGSDFRVCYGGFSNRNGFDLWNGTVGFTQAVGSTNTGDEAISISYKILNFLPGTSRTFNFVTILKSTDKVQAINSLMALSYPGSSTSGPSACSPATSDTAKICGPTMIEVTGTNLSNFNWTWNPPTGLSSSTTFSTIANPSVTTAYTITGVPLPGPCSATTAAVFTIVVVPMPVTTVFNPSITVCAGNPIFLNGTSTGTGGVYTWFGPGGYSSSLISPTITPSTLANSGTYTVSNATSCIIAQTTVSVIALPTVTISSTSNTLCINNTATLTANSSASIGYTWTPSGTLGSPSASITTATPLTNTTYTVIVGAGSCTNSAVKTISVVPSPIIGVLTLTNTTCGLCNGIITASASAGLAPYTYSWSPSVSTQSFVTGLCPDNYSVTIQDGNQCKSTFSSAIAGSAIFQASLTASSTEVFQGEPVTLTGMSGVTYTWSPNLYLSCDVCPVTIATPMDDIAYCVEATSVDNCKDTACIDIIVKCGDIFVPNAFSPNNDGHNDELIVFGNCIKDLVFRIYDRWGEMVYESFDTSNKWDGKYKGYSVTAGVFVYQLSAKLKSGEVVNKKGNITVVK